MTQFEILTTIAIIIETFIIEFSHLNTKPLNFKDIIQNILDNTIGFKSEHNLAYWKLKDYLGFGPGAHSRYKKSLKTIYAFNFYPPIKWKEQLYKDLSPRQNEKILSSEEIRLDKIMMGLRTDDGIDITLIKNKAKMLELSNNNLLESSGSIIRLTSKGKLLLNSIIQQIC